MYQIKIVFKLTHFRLYRKLIQIFSILLKFIYIYIETLKLKKNWIYIHTQQNGLGDKHKKYVSEQYVKCVNIVCTAVMWCPWDLLGEFIASVKLVRVSWWVSCMEALFVLSIPVTLFSLCMSEKETIRVLYCFGINKYGKSTWTVILS